MSQYGSTRISKCESQPIPFREYLLRTRIPLSTYLGYIATCGDQDTQAIVHRAPRPLDFAITSIESDARSSEFAESMIHSSFLF